MDASLNICLSVGLDQGRVFSGAMVKNFCQKVYGEYIHRNTWGNWRKWARVGLGKRSYSFEQFCLLYAIASIRSNTENRYRELGRAEVDTIAGSIETHQYLADFIHLADKTVVIGKEAPIALAAKGCSVSLSSLYRNVPNFDQRRTYDVSYLAKMAKA